MKGGALSSIKKLTTEKIASVFKKPSTEKPKIKSASIQSSKCNKPKSVTKVSMKGGALRNTKKLIAKKIASLVKKPTIGKPKPKLPSIQSSKRSKPKSVTNVSVKRGALPSTKKSIVEK